MSIAKAGFVCFGEVNTPKEVIGRKSEQARKLLEGSGIELVCTDPVSDEPTGVEVTRAVRDLGSGDFDLLILCIAGWIPSHAVISVLFPFRHRPMLLWGLAGWTESGRLVTTADQAGTSALRKPMEDMGLRFRYLYEVHDRPPRMERVVAWAKACRAVRELEGARVGQMGYRDMRLYGTMFDGVSLRSRIGVEVEFFEMLEMVQRGERAAKADALFAEAYSAFASAVGKRELPRIDFEGLHVNYRIPAPGLKVANGAVHANIQLPGLTLRYTMDGTEPTAASRAVEGPIPASGVIRVAAFDGRGRKGPTATLRIQ